MVFRRFPDGRVRYLLINDSYGNWGFPKGHLEPDEAPEHAATREVAEETGLDRLILHGPIDTIDWYFKLRGRLVHKYCHFYLFESPEGIATPQEMEGITACRWEVPDDALEHLRYANARGVLQRGREMVQAMVRAWSDA